MKVADRAAVVDPAGCPAESVVDHFWKTFAGKVPANAIVLASTEEVDPKALRNALDKPLTIAEVPDRAFLFFVDLEPQAKWAHACAYAFVSVSKEAAWFEVDLPPHAAISLKLQRRP